MSEGADVFDRIRYARDRALEAEEAERQRIADADNAEVERAASIRLATRQAVREALDDILDETSEPAKGVSSRRGGDGHEPPGGSEEGTGERTEIDD